jgi:CubicO group peptidase (beta-lactamase class C family)
MRILFTFMCVLALGAMGCGEAAGTGGGGGDGGSAGTGGAGGIDNWAPLDFESNPHSAKYDFGEVDTAMDNFVTAWSTVQGVTLGVVRKGEGQIYEKGYGAFDRDRISLLASVTKPLTAGVILSLVDEGLLELDRPVGEYLDWGDHHPDVTVELILSQMSGIKGLPVPQRDCVFDPDSTVQRCGQEVFQDESLSIPPGEEFRFSGDAWHLAGALAEVVSGKDWVELVEEKLITPCGLPNTGFVNIGKHTDYPEQFDPSDIPPPTDNPVIASGVYSTVNDYSKVLLMHLNDGVCGHVTPTQALSLETVQLMQEDHVPEGVDLPSWRPEAVNFGLGWWRWMFEGDTRLMAISGTYGARAFLHQDADWGAIVILEAGGIEGNIMYQTIVPLIHAAVVEADQN